MKLKIRARDEKGAVLVIVAIVMIALLTLSAGGILVFTLYGANREMQKAADQAALAGAAALPLLRPGVALSNLPLNTVYNLTQPVGLDAPLKSLSSVPDPRAVACAYGTRNLANNNARLISIYGAAPSPPLTGYCSSAPWNDGRVNPSLNSLSTPLSQCINSLTSKITSLTTQLTSQINSIPLVGLVLATLGLGNVTDAVNGILAPLNGLLNSVQNLEALSPALLTPEMTVEVTSGVKPPMISLITGSDGIQMTVSATAQRRLKNAIVLPETPALTGVSLNTALAKAKGPIDTALNSLDSQLKSTMGIANLNAPGCANLLDPATSNIRTDIDDIYNPASGPTARDLLTGATAAATNAAANSGQSLSNVAGEAFLVINQRGTSPQTLSNLVGGLLGPLGLTSLVGSLQVPALDVVIVAGHNLEDGNLATGDCDPTTPTPEGDFICDAAAARGLFTATLVK